MTINEIVNEMLDKIKDEHGVVVTGININWTKMNTASLASKSEFDYFNPEISVSGITKDI